MSSVSYLNCHRDHWKIKWKSLEHLNTNLEMQIKVWNGGSPRHGCTDMFWTPLCPAFRQGDRDWKLARLKAGMIAELVNIIFCEGWALHSKYQTAGCECPAMFSTERVSPCYLLMHHAMSSKKLFPGYKHLWRFQPLSLQHFLLSNSLIILVIYLILYFNSQLLLQFYKIMLFNSIQNQHEG